MDENTVQGARGPLDRERVIRVALELLDEVGLDELSMRSLAQRLGVTAASLYWYVRNKQELLELLADVLYAEMPLPDPGGHWRKELEELARSSRRIMLSHRDAARVLVAALPMGPHLLRRIDALLAVLLRAGFQPPDAADAGYLLNIFVTGFVLEESLAPPSERAPTDGPAGPSAPLGALSQGRLIVDRGASYLTIRGNAALSTLFQVAFEGRPPQIEAQEGMVHLRQRHGRRNSCQLTLAGAIPWEIQIDGGAAHMTADLAALRLSALRIAGGANEVTVRLPPPSGTVPVRIDGGVHRIRIERPPTAAIRLHLQRGSNRIALDGMRLGSVGGGADWESPDYAAARHRYDLQIGGGANDLSIATAAVDTAAASGSEPDLNARVRNWFASQSRADYPNLVALADYLANPDQDRRFEVGLQIFLDGLERRLTASGDSPSNAASTAS
jgi:AcrR family transcriptional regulator